MKFWERTFFLSFFLSPRHASFSFWRERAEKVGPQCGCVYMYVYAWVCISICDLEFVAAKLRGRWICTKSDCERFLAREREEFAGIFIKMLSMSRAGQEIDG